eukprot:8110317-Pyramimonas_sp.AAC.1
MWVIDWSQYYESKRLDLLPLKFLKVGVPVCWLKLVYNAWRSPRIIRLGKHHSVTPLFAICGLPAGGGYNDLAIKVHAYEEFD